MCFLVVPNLPSGSGSCWENVSHYGLFCSISHAMRWTRLYKTNTVQQPSEASATCRQKFSLAEQNRKPLMNSVTVAAYCQIMH